MLDPGSTILSGSLALAIPLALLAGVVSFVSPCVLPLVPGYLGLLGSLASADGKPANARAGRRRMLVGVALFIAGFTAVFVVMNMIVGGLGTFLIQYRDIVLRVLGVVLILAGLVFIGRVSFLQNVWKPGVSASGSLWSAPAIGAAFAIGWTPCSGPVLAAIGTLSVTTGSAWQGAVLGLAYGLGIGIPFFLIALGFGFAERSVAFVKRHMRAINITGGIVLVALGALMLTGVWALVTGAMQEWIGSVETIL